MREKEDKKFSGNIDSINDKKILFKVCDKFFLFFELPIFSTTGDRMKIFILVLFLKQKHKCMGLFNYIFVFIYLL